MNKGDERDRAENQQSALRQQYEGPAKAAASAIASEVKELAQNPSAENLIGLTAQRFPRFAEWVTQLKTDHSQVISVNSEVYDYGVSDFKGRSLDTAFVRVSLRTKNAIRGEYRDACYIFGQINDAEFNVTREPVMAPCDDLAAINRWQIGHQFQSRWIVRG
jgi:hypothetical protein